MTARNKVTSARTDLILSNPFFGALSLGLKIVEDTTCATAWTDGRSLGYNPAFIDGLNHSQCTALIAHEVMHCAMGHPWRRDAREFKQWNIAADRAINSELRESGFTLPEGALFPNAGETGKSAEWYYAREQSQPKGPDPQRGKGKPQPGNGTPQPGKGTPDPLGEVRDAPTTPDADGEPAPSEQEWKQKAAEALNSAKMCGKMPGGLARAVKDALKPRIDIRSLLLRFFSERSTGDYSWSRPNPRYISSGLYLPALESRELGEVAILADTSGSMDSEALAYTRGVVEQVLDEVSPLGTTLYMVDTKVHTVHRMEKGEPLTWEPKGGGGTNFTSFFEQVNSGDVQPVCIIGITDLCATFGTAPDCPVLWLSTTDRTAPFGEVVYVDR